MYKVVTIPSGCCSGDVSPHKIENISNNMAAQGYKLIIAYESPTGCCSKSKSVILIYQRA